MRIRRFLRRDDGQTTVFFAVMMTIIIALVGLSIDVGNLCFTENKLHTAAEAAALSAALELGACAGVNNCSAMQTAATSAMSESGYTGSTLSTNCAATSNTALTLLLNNPPCYRGSSDPNQGKSKYVEAVVSMPVPTYFVRLIGYSTVQLTARAESVRTSNPNCIYALDQTSANAITVATLASLTATCGVVDESNSSGAFGCALFATVSVPNLKITGGLQSLLCTVNPAPRTSVPVPNPADPLSTLPKPAVLSCGASVLSPYHGSAGPLVLVGNAVLYPDAAYCGGITVGPLANVTFMPGTYVIRSIGPLGGVTFSLLSTVTGSGVTFYNYGPYGGSTS